MSLRKYLPWRSIQSWRRMGCGRCCKEYQVILSLYGYASVLRTFGPSPIRIDSFGNPCLKQMRGRYVLQAESGSCILQPLSLKPLACKLWPFSVGGSESRRGCQEEALFHHRGKEYYIYVNPACTGMNKGKPEELPLTLHETVEISQKPSAPQKQTTSNHFTSIESSRGEDGHAIWIDEAISFH